MDHQFYFKSFVYLFYVYVGHRRDNVRCEKRALVEAHKRPLLFSEVAV